MKRWYSYLIILGLAALGVYRANVLRWYCDDIFITLRYVGNVLEGNGIVYNQGEYVEGYTHFLWLLILTLSQWMGFDPLQASMNIGLASLAGVLLIFCLISYRLNRTRLVIFIPLSGLVLAVHHDFLIWATGGLETMFFTFLCSLAFFVYFFSGIRRNGRLLVTGLIMILAVLTRPDGALIFILGNLFLLGSFVVRRDGLRVATIGLLLFNLPFVCLYAPYLIWKYGYYGDIYPNTYYAKSAGLHYFQRGFYYLWLYFKAYFTSWLFLLGIPALIWTFYATLKGGDGGRRKGPAELLTDKRFSSLAFAICGVFVYAILFVARVGGDFMYARFIVPAVPFMIFAVESGILYLMRTSRLLPALLFVALAVVVWGVEKPNRDDLLLTRNKRGVVTASHKGIIDERHYYKNQFEIDKQIEFGEFLEPHFRDLDATVLLVGQAYLGYYANFRTCIDNYGLTDAYIAHLPLEARSRVGHEKRAPYDYLVEIGADFVFERRQLFRDKIRKYKLAAFKPGRGRIVRAEIITYDKELIESLAERLGDRFVYRDFEKNLDGYISKELPRKRPEQLLKDYREFREYYFLHNEDPERERVFLKKLEEHGVLRAE